MEEAAVADALDEVTAAVKQEITLSTGIIGLSLTFRKELMVGQESVEWLIETSWVLFGLSVLGGLLTLHKAALMRTVGVVDINKPDIRVPWLICVSSFLLGLAAFVTFGFLEFK